MKFLLTLYICSLVTGECVMPKLEELDIKQFYGTHYGCVRAGLGDSFELLFNGEYFNEKTINEWKLYPKFSCVPVEDESLPTAPGIPS